MKSDQKDFIMEEYNSAVKLTYHVDDMRSRLMSYFLTIGGALVAGGVLIFKKEVTPDKQKSVELIMAGFMQIYTLIGCIFVIIIGRLRRAQFEHFRIINNIRNLFLKDSLKLWNTVQLSSLTLPTSKRTTGSYLWSLPVNLFSAISTGLSLFIFINNLIPVISLILKIIISLVWALIILFVFDFIYMRISRLEASINYKNVKLPPKK